MKLPKYDTFSIVGIINIFIGIYIYKWLISIGLGVLNSVFTLMLYDMLIIWLYEKLRIELNKKDDN